MNKYPLVKLLASTVGGGVSLVMYKQENFDKDTDSDAYVKTYGSFNDLIQKYKKDSSRMMITDQDALEVLNCLTPVELDTFKKEKYIITGNIPPNVVEKYRSDRKVQDVYENKSMNKKEKLKIMIHNMIREELCKAATELNENDIGDDIKDLEKLLKNPDPERVKDYGSEEEYKKMIRGKIDKLKAGGKNKLKEQMKVLKKFVKKVVAEELNKSSKNS